MEATGEREVFSARKVPATQGQPYGVKYSLVLLSREGQRLIGYDNAHGYEEHRKIEWDHSHDEEAIKPYDYTSAGQLLADFWAGVDGKLFDED